MNSYCSTDFINIDIAISSKLSLFVICQQRKGIDILTTIGGKIRDNKKHSRKYVVICIRSCTEFPTNFHSIAGVRFSLKKPNNSNVQQLCLDLASKLSIPMARIPECDNCFVSKYFTPKSCCDNDSVKQYIQYIMSNLVRK